MCIICCAYFSPKTRSTSPKRTLFHSMRLHAYDPRNKTELRSQHNEPWQQRLVLYLFNSLAYICLLFDIKILFAQSVITTSSVSKNRSNRGAVHSDDPDFATSTISKEYFYPLERTQQRLRMLLYAGAEQPDVETAPTTPRILWPIITNESVASPLCARTLFTDENDILSYLLRSMLLKMRFC